jgi:hypothetical protein
MVNNEDGARRMKQQPDTIHGWGQDLSDLADGRASPAQVRALSEAWASDAALRRDWQALHLLGDTLRSAELAAQAQRSDALLAALRERLAAEPALLHTGRPSASARWLAPLAVAAGFVGLALIVPGLQSSLTPAKPLQFAQQNAASPESMPSSGLFLDQGEPSFVQTLMAPPDLALQTAYRPRPAHEPTPGLPTR